MALASVAADFFVKKRIFLDTTSATAEADGRITKVFRLFSRAIAATANLLPEHCDSFYERLFLNRFLECDGHVSLERLVGSV